MALKYRIYIQAVKRNSKQGERVSLFQRLYYQGQQYQYSLGISLPLSDYDAERMAVKGKDAQLHNYTITESQNIMRDILMRIDLIEHRVPTLDEVTYEYERVMREKGITSKKPKVADEEIHDAIYDIMLDFINQEGKLKGWSDEMKKKFQSIRTNIKNYSTKHKQILRLSTLTDKDLNNLCDFLLDGEMLNSTLSKKVSYIRWFLRWCVRQGLYNGNLHETFKPKFKGGYYEQHNIIYLTEEELHTVENYEFTADQKHLERVRDYFIFACYSGLRYSDVKQLRPAHVSNDAINLVTQKTTDRLSINLNKHTRAMLDKYKEWSKATGYCFPVISNQKTNKCLHEILELCEINTPTSQIYFHKDERREIWLTKYEMVTFHAARRTFITQAYRLGIPTDVIMKFSGHHSHAMLKQYMKVVDEMKEKEMAKFDLM